VSLLLACFFSSSVGLALAGVVKVGLRLGLAGARTDDAGQSTTASTVPVLS
jgi:hypothetical protein